jgi:hypothetical protein
MRTAKTFLALAVAAALWGCHNKPEPALSTQAPVNLNERVKVLAADVLVVDGQHYRVANAFAPQGIPDARCWAEALAAREAEREVKEMVSTAHTIDMKPSGGRDDYNRIYALINLDGLDLGQTLFERSLAARPPKGRFEWCNPLSESREGAPPLSPLMGD